jgi:hypothetical protein
MTNAKKKQALEMDCMKNEELINVFLYTEVPLLTICSQFWNTFRKS